VVEQEIDAVGGERHQLGVWERSDVATSRRLDKAVDLPDGRDPADRLRLLKRVQCGTVGRRRGPVHTSNVPIDDGKCRSGRQMGAACLVSQRDCAAPP